MSNTMRIMNIKRHYKMKHIGKVDILEIVIGQSQRIIFTQVGEIASIVKEVENILNPSMVVEE